MATAAVELRLAKRSFKYDPNTAAPKPQPNVVVPLDPIFVIEVRFPAPINMLSCVLNNECFESWEKLFGKSGPESNKLA